MHCPRTAGHSLGSSNSSACSCAHGDEPDLRRRAGVLDAALIWSELLPLLELRDDQTTESRLRGLLERRAP
jgi:hypothetical protein